jgi:hypothetical protein
MEYIPVAQEAALGKFGCRGLLSIVGIGPKGFAVSRIFGTDGDDDVCYWGQKSNASFAAANMLMRFYSTYDLEYARETVYPYLKETGAFWEDYLVFKDGRYFDYNDCAHENAILANKIPEWNWGAEKDYSNDCNPVVSLGLIRMVFKGLLDLHQELGDNNPRAEKWRHILDHISPFPVQERNGKTVFRLTESGMAWNKGNVVAIQHVFPAGAIGLGSDKALLKIALDTVDEMGVWEDGCGFCTFYTAAARIGFDPAVILKNLKEQIGKHGFPNMYIYYGGGGIECCSGVPGSVNEMLLQSHEGILRFFPVWEKNKDAEFYNLRAYGAFLVSASIKDGKTGTISLYSEKGRNCMFQNPFKKCNVYQVSDGEAIPVTLDVNGETCSLPTKAGTTYIIKEGQ